MDRAQRHYQTNSELILSTSNTTETNRHMRSRSCSYQTNSGLTLTRPANGFAFAAATEAGALVTAVALMSVASELLEVASEG
jgi:hypothetical protein